MLSLSAYRRAHQLGNAAYLRQLVLGGDYELEGVHARLHVALDALRAALRWAVEQPAFDGLVVHGQLVVALQHVNRLGSGRGRVVAHVDPAVQHGAEVRAELALVPLARQLADERQRVSVLLRTDDARDPAVAQPGHAGEGAVKGAGGALGEEVVGAHAALLGHVAAAGDDDGRVRLAGRWK